MQRNTVTLDKKTRSAVVQGRTFGEVKDKLERILKLEGTTTSDWIHRKVQDKVNQTLHLIQEDSQKQSSVQ